jgi:predicted CoA-binding protein
MSQTVAVIGASGDRHKYGNKALRAFARRGYKVIPVNTHEAEVEGHRAYRSVLDIPGSVDIATVYVPPASGLTVVEELARKGIREVWLNPGADDEEVVARGRALGLHIIQACSIIAIGELPSRY